MPLFDARQAIPGYADFVDEQDAIRDTAFLGLPREICGIPVLPLTTRHLLWLLTIKSPFVGAAPVDFGTIEIQIAAFMRVLSPGFSPTGKWRRRLFFWRYRRNKVDPVKMMDGIFTFLHKQMQDRPPGSGKYGEAYWSIGANIVHALASRYGWPLEECLDCPIAVAYQLLKIQRYQNAAEKCKTIALFNPSDDFKTRWFDKIENDLREYEAELSGAAKWTN